MAPLDSGVGLYATPIRSKASCGPADGTCFVGTLKTEIQMGRH